MKTLLITVSLLVVLVLVLAIGGAMYADCASDCTFKRGDFNGDGNVDLSDVTAIYNWAFQGGAGPCNKDGGDVDDSGAVDLTDGVYLNTFLFLGGPAPPKPGPHVAGCDCSPDDLEACCSPTGGTLTVTNRTGTPQSGFDCDNFMLGGETSQVELESYNNKDCQGAVDDECDHDAVSTTWNVTYTINDTEGVKQDAFDAGCVLLQVNINLTATWNIGGPCTPGGTGTGCLSGSNTVLAVLETIDMVFQGPGGEVTEKVTLTGDPPGHPSYQYEQKSPTCAIGPVEGPSGPLKKDSAAYEAKPTSPSFSSATACHNLKKIVFGSDNDFAINFLRDTEGDPQPDIAKDEGMKPLTITVSPLQYVWCPGGC